MYSLGKRSRERLNGVHPDLVKVVERAIEISTVDFAVLEGLRQAIRLTAATLLATLSIWGLGCGNMAGINKEII